MVKFEVSDNNSLGTIYLFLLLGLVAATHALYSLKSEVKETSKDIIASRYLDNFEALGTMNVSMYSHHECGGNLYTASSYKIKPLIDAQRICAVSRDQWQIKIHQGDILYIKELNLYLVAMDTMAVKHPKTKAFQKNWIDIYEPDMVRVDAFGLQKLTVYRLRR